MDLKPIPAFYCCYLLRSTVRHSSLYVGSTPNPVRRLAQHNGRAKGGAARTSKEQLRPWEMACIVSGFPSHIAALQFEWAWQNTHTTRHIPPSERLTEVRHNARGRILRPRATLTDKLANLHLLLRVQSFRPWPLEVIFFCEDVYRVWKTWTERVPATIRDGVRVVLDFAPGTPLADTISGRLATQAQNGQVAGAHGIERLDVGYAGLKSRLQKSMGLLANGRESSCAVCRQPVRKGADMLVFCPSDTCEAISHLTCLSKHFLQNGKPDDRDAIVPIAGACAQCKQPARWVDIVKELSLRTRGEKEIEKLLKAPSRGKASKDRTGRKRKASPLDNEEDDGSLSEAVADIACSVPLERAQGLFRTNNDDDDGWRYIDEEEDDDDDHDDDDNDRMSVTSLASERSQGASASNHGVLLPPRKPNVNPTQRLEIVIEDSDWDEAEILD